jgi:23S rRNA (guanosine2251-2'-O)-methyltransferase
MEILYGLHPVEEALRSGSRKFDHVCVARERHDPRLQRLVDACRENGIRVRPESRDELTRLAKTPGHQGVVAIVRGREFLDLEDLLDVPEPDSSQSDSPQPGGSDGPAPRLLLALDGIEDPQNLGALLRTADASGVDGVIVTERRAAPLSAVAVKASAGAAEHVRIARVVNLVRALEQLKEHNIWCVGLDERGTSSYDEYDFTSNTVIVLGREGDGLHDLVRRTCDHLLRIPMAGRVASLNVSAAGAVVMFEAARQRRLAQKSVAAQTAPAAQTMSRRERKGLGS